MNLPILTHDARIYVVAILALCCGTCGELAFFVQRVMARRAWRPPFLRVYAAVMACMVAVAAVVVDLAALVPRTWLGAAGSAGAGLVVGAIAWRSEVAFKMRYLVGRDERRGGIGVAPRYEAAPSALLLVAIGALEEILFRGVLFELARAVESDVWEVAAHAGVNLLFLAIHVRLGRREMISKIPLGLLGFAATLITGNVAAAVAGHAWFNLRAASRLGARGSRWEPR